MKEKVYVVRAFCKDFSGGNKAGVVLFSPELTGEQKLNIAKQVGFSETVFVNYSQVADYKLEYYTPTDEVPLCGHATIACFGLMHGKDLLKKEKLTIETKAGILEIEVSADGLVMMQQNNPVSFGFVDGAELTPCFGEGKIKSDAPIEIISTGLKDVLLPIKDRDSLDTLQTDFQKIADISSKLDVVGFHAFTMLDTLDEVDALCRNFAPLYGIDEEAATGTSNCALAAYLFKTGNRKNRYVFDQGYSLNSPSRHIVKLESDGDEITRISVGGYSSVESYIELLL